MQYGDNRESVSRVYTDIGDPGGSGTATIEGAEAEVIQITGVQKGGGAATIIENGGKGYKDTAGPEKGTVRRQ